MTKIEPIGIGGLHRGLSIPEIYIENTKLHDEVNGLRKQRRKAREKNKQLQSNWNSLRELIETDNKRAKGYIERIRTSDLCHGDYPVEYYYAEKRKEITDYYLDKMNELEGEDNENNS